MIIFEHKKYYIIILALFGIFFTSCVETIINVRIHPDGRYTMGFLTKGDSSDVFDYDFPHPSGLEWSTSIAKRPGDEGDIWLMSTKGILNRSNIFTSRDDSLVALNYPIQVEKKIGFFAIRYTLKNIFKGRQIYRKYPAFGKSLQESDADSTRWLDEAFYYMCSQGLKDLQNDPNTIIDNEIIDRVNNHIQNTLARVSQKKLFDELENKETFINQMLKPFNKKLPNGYSKILSKSTDIYEEELRLTSDLQDDQFLYCVFMPGAVTSTNADTIENDTLKWSFGLQQYINDDYVIEAASIVYSPQRIQIAILISAVLVLVILYLAYKRRQ